MTRYNPKLRSHDQKKANMALRKDNANLRRRLFALYNAADLAEEEAYAAGYSHGERASKASAAQVYQAALVKQRRQLRNHRALSGVLLVLAVAGWLV